MKTAFKIDSFSLKTLILDGFDQIPFARTHDEGGEISRFCDEKCHNPDIPFAEIGVKNML